jgi:hypothetical protein
LHYTHAAAAWILVKLEVMKILRRPESVDSYKMQEGVFGSKNILGIFIVII